MILKTASFVLAVSLVVLAAPRLSYAQNAELVNAVAKEIGSTPKQAEGATGAMFGLAKSKLSPADWGKVSGAVPGMAGLLKAAPAVDSGGASNALSSATSALSGAGGLGNLAALAGSFSKLGLKPEMAMKMVPVLTQFVTKSGGADVGKLLAGVLK